MNEIIQRLTEKTGLSEENANAAVNTVVGFLKEKLPSSMASQIDSLLAGGAGMGERVGGIAKGIGGMFGRKE
jgi:hypothetical protein